MFASDLPNSAENDAVTRRVLAESSRIVLAWGVNGGWQNRDREWLELFREVTPEKLRFRLCCLGVTKAGHPKHPLYLRKNARLVVYRGQR